MISGHHFKELNIKKKQNYVILLMHDVFMKNIQMHFIKFRIAVIFIRPMIKIHWV